MTLTDRQAFNLEMEFLQQDLGRLPSEMPISTIKRELTRALYERATTNEGTCPRPIIPVAHSAIEDAVAAVVAALDKVVTAWEKATVVTNAQPQVVDGVRAAATIIAEAAERAGLTMPVPPKPAPAYDVDAEAGEGMVDGVPAADWTPSDGGLTPSMFGGI